MADAARPVFISYARLDQPLVSRAVEFLRGGGLNVFVDSQSIAYGTDWRQALVDAIENAERVMLFWTAAAAVSVWVTREWQLALKRGKKVVPTLLDDTPLPPALARLQAVTTLRGLFPAPVRRPEDFIAEPPLPDDDGDEVVSPFDSSADRTHIRYPGRTPAGAAPQDPDINLWANRQSDTLKIAQPRFRPTLVVGGLAAAGLVTWLVLIPAPRELPVPIPNISAGGVIELPSTAPPEPASAVSSSPAASVPRTAPVPTSTVPPEAASAVSSSPAASVPRTAPVPAPTPSAEPAGLDEMLDDVLLPTLAGLLLLLSVGFWALRRFIKHRRARAVVREVYAL